MDKQQQVVDQQSIYQASYGNIFAKNFLAGFSRGLGAVFAQLLFFLLIFFLFIRFFAPQLQPVLNLLERSVSTMESVQRLQPGRGNVESSQEIDISELLKQLENSPTITR